MEVVGLGIVFVITGFGLLGATVMCIRMVVDIIGQAVEKQAMMMAGTIEQVSGVVQRVAVESMRQVVGAALGENDVPVQQRTVPVEDDLNNPAWTKWEDGPENEWEAGPGDSVYFERASWEEGAERTAYINDGESVIPGVPLPDMTGENYDETKGR